MSTQVPITGPPSDECLDFKSIVSVIRRKQRERQPQQGKFAGGVPLEEQTQITARLQLARERLRISRNRLLFAERFASASICREELERTKAQLATLCGHYERVVLAHRDAASSMPALADDVADAEDSYNAVLAKHREQLTRLEFEREARKQRWQRCSCLDGSDASGNECLKCLGRKWLKPGAKRAGNPREALRKRMGFDDPATLATMLNAGVDVEAVLTKLLNSPTAPNGAK